MPSLPARRASIVPTSTATVAYELTPSTSQVANTVQQVAQGLLGWLPPAMQAVGTMCKFLGAVVDRVREKAAAVLPPMPGLTAEVGRGVRESGPAGVGAHAGRRAHRPASGPVWVLHTLCVQHCLPVHTAVGLAMPWQQLLG